MFNLDDLDLAIKDNETEDEYVIRICGLKEKKGLYWDEIANILNKALDYNYTESRYRKIYAAYKKGIVDAIEGEQRLNDDFKIKETERRENYAESIDRIAYARLLRQDARFERFYKLVGEQISQLPPPQFLNEDKINSCVTDDKEHVLCFADLHIGAKFVSINNSYSMQEAKNRFEKALAYCRDYVSKNNVRKLTVLSLGDEVQGMLRISDLKLNEKCVVDAFVFAERLIANFLNELSKYCYVDYKMVIYSNHNQNRYLGTKASELAGEDMGKVLYGYLTDVLALNDRITVYANDEADYTEFKIFDFNFIMLHGHQINNIQNAIKDLSNTHHKFYDYVILGHTHSLKEYPGGEGQHHNMEVLVAPSVCGSDPYADKLQVGSKAGMVIFEFDKKYGYTDKHNIILN